MSGSPYERHIPDVRELLSSVPQESVPAFLNNLYTWMSSYETSSVQSAADSSQHYGQNPLVYSTFNRKKKTGPRKAWSPELHQQFVRAWTSIDEAGVTPSPKKIMMVMQENGACMDDLTIRQVQSHHQKYKIKRANQKKQDHADSTLASSSQSLESPDDAKPWRVAGSLSMDSLPTPPSQYMADPYLCDGWPTTYPVRASKSMSAAASTSSAGSLTGSADRQSPFSPMSRDSFDTMDFYPPPVPSLAPQHSRSVDSGGSSDWSQRSNRFGFGDTVGSYGDEFDLHASLSTEFGYTSPGLSSLYLDPKLLEPDVAFWPLETPIVPLLPIAASPYMKLPDPDPDLLIPLPPFLEDALRRHTPSTSKAPSPLNARAAASSQPTGHTKSTPQRPVPYWLDASQMRAIDPALLASLLDFTPAEQYAASVVAEIVLDH